MIKQSQIFVCLLLFGSILVGCSGTESDKSLKILATIGDRLLTTDEFIERAELTPRQPYCSSNTPRDKAIVLNTLIVEKILAIEVQNEPALRENKKFQAYLQGRREQHMRELFFLEKAYNAVKLDTAEIVNAFQFAGREYEVEFQVVNRTESEKIQKRFTENRAKKNIIFNEISLAKRYPRKKITWNDQETPDIVYSTLFTESYQINDVIGPIQTGYDEFLVIKIVDWKDSKTFGGTQSLILWKDVENKLVKIRANQIWADYTTNLMKGKKIEFNQASYLKVFELFESWLARNNERKNSQLPISKDEVGNENLAQVLSDEQFLKLPFCKIDQEMWTVADLKNVVLSHPLVLRKEEVKNREDLEEQFKLAIADLIRDKYITQDAYNKGYDKREDVRRYVQKWHDAYAAVYHRDKFLKKVSLKKDFNRAQMRGSNTYLSMYLDSLITVYNDRISINQPLYEEIKLTSVPMYAVQYNRPFVLATPAFPLLTDNDNLNF